ncbi:HesA/MoeB/ThiF family protein [Aequorivita echinoideorum]|uniref:HesA/MoeB/ThiF family protein n=1 Tax=Aequorivita echinoideorum TaxID=1549647 RepID=A0ABS5S4G7_9FLAO|nr:HesA/MoeB/ThiF family protein [Aequorivita echinoideorum]MBT0608117.1 HesA/MoeB/ThiF family protein [Aequorivita echinoideorum]
MNPKRYIRQTSLKEFGSVSQKKLSLAKVLVVGVGGLGVPVLQYLNAMGVGTLGVIDNDFIHLANLQRQVLYSENDLGKSKAEVASKKLKAQNSETNFIIFKEKLQTENALNIIEKFDIIVDASDNFPTRYLINDACVISNKPFVYGALQAFEGQVSVFNYKNGPTYRCLFPKMPSAEEIPDCNVNGVLGVIPGIIGCLQALEVVKIITELGEILSGKLLLFDGLTQKQQSINFKLKPENLQISELQSNYGFNESSQINSISATNFLKLQNFDDFQVIDVRNADEIDFQKQKKLFPKNWIHIPLTDLERRISEINLQQKTYFVCQSGVRSKKAISLLKNNSSPENLINIEGGMNALNEISIKI